ncbi:TPA: hypothetical protein ACH3X1_014535 [Trebouxia sp. C0004]
MLISSKLATSLLWTSALSDSADSASKYLANRSRTSSVDASSTSPLGLNADMSWQLLCQIDCCGGCSSCQVNLCACFDSCCNSLEFRPDCLCGTSFAHFAWDADASVRNVSHSFVLRQLSHSALHVA